MAKTYFYPFIDYREHPAFRCLDVAPRTDDQEVETLIDKIDGELAALHARLHRDNESLERAFADGPAKSIANLASYLNRTSVSDRWRKRFDRGFHDVRGELLAEAAILNSRKTYAKKLDCLSAQQVYDDLDKTGAHVFRIDEGTIRRLRDLTSSQRDSLREKAQREPDRRWVENFGRYSDVGVNINRIFRTNGVLEGLSAYVGANTIFAGLALEYSHEKQRWWKGCYSDVGLPDTQTTYMHYDHGCKNPKAIIAMSDVEEENGPTSFVSGSHRQARSNFAHFIVKSVEQTFYDDYRNEANSTYYRRMFAEVEHRRDFLKLPRALQSCTHFGEDICDGTSLSNELLSKEIRLTKDVGNCVVFDGDYGIHRGATVSRGDRFAFQIIFSIEPTPSVFQALNWRIRFLVKKALGLRR